MVKFLKKEAEKKRRIQIMGSIKNLLLHCQETMKKYDDNVNEDNLRCKHINQGWIEALIFVERNFNITEKTTGD